ncbi:MAG: TolC family protein [Lacibacter sp.]
MKKILFLFLVIGNTVFSQTATLDKVVEAAKQNYPLVKQKDLIRQTKEISIENIGKGYLPQFTLSGQATYQSDVTSVKIPVPGISITPPSKDQYKVVADVNQLIWDGGFIKEQKNIQQLNADVEDQKIEVELYKLTERINQIYLSILFIEEQLKQTGLIKKDLETGLKKTEAQVQNGVAFKSNLNLLKAEILKIEQRVIELKATRKGLTDVLSLFTGEQYSEATVFEKPSANFASGETIQRPELTLFQKQQNLLNGQNNIIKARNLPKTSLFFQGGYGRPGLNMLENNFKTFYITGVRFNWAFGGLYTAKKEKQLIDINKKIISVQQDVFVLNTNTQLKQQLSEMDKISQLIAKDLEIIELRVKVKEAANAQLENGVITANDYLREVNAEDQARQTLIVHQIQLLQAQINYQTTKGK